MSNKALSSFLTLISISVICVFIFNGCVVRADRDGFVPVGSIEVLWSIDGEIDPSFCDVPIPVQSMEVRIHDIEFGLTTVETFDCIDFGVLVDLEIGLYDLELTLIDFANRVATPTVTLENIEVIEGLTTTVEVDYPLRDFL